MIPRALNPKLQPQTLPWGLTDNHNNHPSRDPSANGGLKVQELKFREFTVQGGAFTGGMKGQVPKFSVGFRV